MRFFNKLMCVGLNNSTSKEQAKEIAALNAINTSVLVVSLFLIPINIVSYKYTPAIIEFAAILFGVVPFYFLQHNKQYDTAKILLFAYTCLSITLISLYAVLNFKNVNTEIILIAFVSGTVVFFNGKKKTIGFTVLAMLYFAIIIFKYYYWQHKPFNEFIFECINTSVLFIAAYVIVSAFKIYFTEYEQKLLDTNKRLLDINEEKDKLFSIIAHDLRSPLASLNQILLMHAEGNLSKSEFEMLVSKISKNATQTSELLENLLHWSSSQLKGFKVNKQHININQIASEKIDMLLPLAQQKNITIHNNAPNDIFAFADANMIKIIIRNLLSNAIKFSPRNTTVTIDAVMENNYVKVSVKDEGIGINIEDVALLFVGLNHTTPGTENEKGTGIGLALCKEFIEKNDGKILAEKLSDKGSHFYFTLPVM